MLHLNGLAWKARLKIEFRSFMVTNFTTIGGAVTEEDKVMTDVFRGRRWTFEKMVRSTFEAERRNVSDINVRIIFSEVSEVSLFSFTGMPWNSKLNSFERSSCMIAALRFSVAYSWSSVSRLASLLSRFSIFSWATSKLVSTAVIRRFRLDSICARRLSTDWSNWNTSFSAGSLCAFCAIGFLECLKVTFSMTLQATALTRSSLLLGCLQIGKNRLWLRFRKYIKVFTLFVDWVGQTYAGLFRRMQNFSNKKNCVYNICEFHCELWTRLWEEGLVQVAYKNATTVAFYIP